MAKQPLILVVDDEEDVATTFSLVIQKSGRYRVLTAHSGQEALDLIQERNRELFKRDPVRLVLLDIRMPGMSGIEVLEKLPDVDPDLKVVMVTAYDEDDYWLESAVSNAAIDFLIKPPTREMLLGVVDAYFQDTRRATRIHAKYGERNLDKRLEEEKKRYQTLLDRFQQSGQAQSQGVLDVLQGDIGAMEKRIHELEGGAADSAGGDEAEKG